METSKATGTPKEALVFISSVIGIGIIVCLVAACYLPVNRLDLFFCGLAIVTIFFGSRLSVKIPRSEVYFMMGDALIFITFLRYGGETGVLLATVEALVFSLSHRKQFPSLPNITVLFNGGTIACATAAAYTTALFYPTLSGKPTNYENIVEFFTLLGMMALVQFSVNSFLAAWVTALITRNKMTIRQAWKEKCLSGSITIIAGAATAGVVYKIIEYSDFLAIFVVISTVGLIYWACSHYIEKQRKADEQTEQAEREKAEANQKRLEAEQKRREDAERHNKEIEVSKELYKYAALHDSLTGLPNRSYFAEQVQQELGKNKLDSRHGFSVLYLDLNRFKTVNDSLGHDVGDELLILVGRRLKNIIRSDDMVARLGGDEFALLLPGVIDSADAISFAERVQKSIGQQFQIHQHQVFTAPSIGITVIGNEYSESENILRNADLAMYHAKENDLPYAVFDSEMRNKLVNVQQIETDLRLALEREELRVFYQPIISLETGELKGFEALMRWEHPEQGLVPPIKFIGVAEGSDLIVPMTLWILRESCQQLKEWQSQSPLNASLMVSVNLSARHLAQPELVEQVKQVLAETNLDARFLKLEITESSVMRDTAQAAIVLERLKTLGVQLSIDDFGTGLSSLSYLHRFPVDVLKIDRSFVNRIGKKGENSEIVRHIIALAQDLKLEVIAEGIETIEQLEELQKLGCRFAQGYLFSKPEPQSKIEQMMLERSSNWFGNIFSHRSVNVKEPRTTTNHSSYGELDAEILITDDFHSVADEAKKVRRVA